MRRRKKHMEKLKLKVIEDKRNGLTYEEIRTKRGVSPSTISQLTKGKNLSKFCKMCGENDPKKLEEHHPDKEQYPNHTVALCANCHSKITRNKLSEKRKAQQEVIVPKSLEVSPIKIQSPASFPQSSANTINPVNPSNVPLLTREEGEQLAQSMFYGLGGVLAGEGALDKDLSWYERLMFFGLAGFSFWVGKKVSTRDPSL